MNFHEYLSNIKAEPTAHGSGKKLVFKNNKELNSNLTQIAYGKFAPGETCEEHIHPSMDECFFFIKGEGLYHIGENTVELKDNTFLIIPAGEPHSLEAKGQSDLEFVYWGIAVG